MDDEDEELASQVRQLGEPAIKDLHRYLTAPPEAQTDVLRQLIARREHDDLRQLLAIANVDEVARLRLLRAIRDA